MPTLLIVQHVPHEGVGTFEQPFKAAGLTLQLLRATDQQATWPDLEDIAGLVVMGGPQSVYEPDRFSSVARELALLREALAARLPILGVCLGAQLLAAALGSSIMKNPQKEIGWYPLMREPEAEVDPIFRPFGQTETVFQWHGDTFALPRDAVRLASSPLCREQAFRYRDHAYGLQFHVEVTEAMIRRWLSVPGNRRELAALRGVIEPAAIRGQAPRHLDRLQALSRHVATTFAALVMARAGQPAQR